jgi:murein L,D-transpeptidase YafK
LNNLPASEFARRRGTETDVVKCFEKKFLTNAEQDAPISKDRKTQTNMELIRKARIKGKASGFTIETNEFCEDVSLEFQEEEENIQRQIEGMWGAKVGWGMLTAAGVVALGVSTQMSSSQKNKILKMGTMGVGGTTAILSGAKFYSVMGDKNTLQQKKDDIQTMKNAWENSFKVQ